MATGAWFRIARHHEQTEMVIGCHSRVQYRLTMVSQQAGSLETLVYCNDNNVAPPLIAIVLDDPKEWRWVGRWSHAAQRKREIEVVSNQSKCAPYTRTGRHQILAGRHDPDRHRLDSTS